MPRKEYNTKADFDADYDINGEPEGHPNTRPGMRLGYCRASMLPYARTRAQKLVEIYNWPTTTSTRLLFFGCGLNLTAEVLELEYGYPRVLGIDLSPWVLANYDLDEEQEYRDACTAVGVDPDSPEGIAKRNINRLRAGGAGPRCRATRGIRDYDISKRSGRSAVVNNLGSPTHIISIDVLPALEDNEAVQISSNLHKTKLVSASTEVIHLVTELCPFPEGDKRYFAQDTSVFNLKSKEDWKALLPDDTIISLHTWGVV